MINSDEINNIRFILSDGNTNFNSLHCAAMRTISAVQYCWALTL